MAKDTKSKGKKPAKGASAKPAAKKASAVKAKPAAKKPAAKKPAPAKAKPAAKKAAPAKAKAPVKKAAPAKAKPAPKKAAAKPAAKAKAPVKKAAPAKAAPAKAAAKPVAKKPAAKAAPAKPVKAEVVKPQAKAPEKKVVAPAPKAEVKPAPQPEKKAAPAPEKKVVPAADMKPAKNPMVKSGPQAKPQVPASHPQDSGEKEKLFYSKEELEEFREIINTKLNEAREEYKQLSESLKESNEMAADGYNMTEFGSDTIDKEQNEMFLVRQKKFIQQLEAALVRIENGTYGRCKVTGKLIPKERLRLVPHTESSMEAKLLQKDAPPRQFQQPIVPSNLED